MLSRAARVAVLTRTIPGTIRSIIPGAGTPTCTRIVRIVFLHHKACTPSLAQPGLNSFAQRSAVRCRAVPLALRCGVMSCCAFGRTYTARYHAKVPGTTTTGTGTNIIRSCTRVFVKSFRFLHLIVLCRSFSRFFLNRSYSQLTFFNICIKMVYI